MKHPVISHRRRLAILLACFSLLLSACRDVGGDPVIPGTTVGQTEAPTTDPTGTTAGQTETPTTDPTGTTQSPDTTAPADTTVAADTSGPDEPVIKLSAFGTLLEYRGTDEELTLQRGTKKISADAFADRGSAARIKKLTFKGSWPEIEEGALDNLISLTEVTFHIDAVSTKPITVTKDGEITLPDLGYSDLGMALNEIGLPWGDLYRLFTLGEGRMYTIGGLVLKMTDGRLKQVVYAGNEITLEGEGIEYSGNLIFSAIEGEDFLLLCSTSNTTERYVIGKDGSVDHYVSPQYTGLCFWYEMEDGVLRYTAKPQKYLPVQWKGGYAEFSAAYDELYEARGIMMYEDGEVVHLRQSSKTIHEYCDLDEDYRTLQEYEPFAQYRGRPIEELFADNLEKYGLAK